MQNFLIANALFLIEHYHVTARGMRHRCCIWTMESRTAVVPNQYGGNQNLEAIAFFATNSVVLGRNR
ncbi:MAG: hypothetical protein ACLTGA_11945 [Roseburia sp.]